MGGGSIDLREKVEELEGKESSHYARKKTGEKPEHVQKNDESVGPRKGKKRTTEREANLNPINRAHGCAGLESRIIRSDPVEE